MVVGDGRPAIARSHVRTATDNRLADIGMPERDGYEVAAFIRAIPSLRTFR